MIRCTRHDAENLLLALLYGYFVHGHLQQAHAARHSVALLPIIAQESLIAALFIVRRRAVRTSSAPFDWFIGALGTFLPLCVRPGGTAYALGIPLQLVGFAISLAALLSLGRSLGIVAANRGVRTGGAYRIVRHPMYAGHIVCLVGYLATYPSVYNLAVIAVTFVALWARIRAEEELLMRDPSYWVYCLRVQYRLVPGVY